MGCCQNSNKPEKTILLTNIKDSMKRDLPQKLSVMLNLQLSPGLTIDSCFLDHNNMVLSPLSYSVVSGSLKCFKMLLKLKASPIEMEKNLSTYRTSALSILCTNNRTEFLIFYIPIYLENYEISSSSFIEKKETIEFDKTLEHESSQFYTPIQKACELGNITMVSTIYNAVKELARVPPCLDINYQEETTGENCVLIACRRGDFKMIRFLNEFIKTSFEVMNFKGEDAITVLLAANRRDPNKNYFDCLVYLIETVKLDIIKNFEEMLLLAFDIETINYLESRLKTMGIHVNKNKLEEIYKINLNVRSEENKVELNNQLLNEIQEDSNRTALSSIRVEEQSVSISMMSIK